MEAEESIKVKSYAENPPMRLDDGEIAVSLTPRRGILLYKSLLMVVIVNVGVFFQFPIIAGNGGVENVDGILWSYNDCEGIGIHSPKYDVPAIPKDTRGSIVVPSKLNGLPVMYIESDAFRNCRFLTDVFIPPSVHYVSGCAFYGCIGMKAILVAPDNPWLSSHSGLLLNKEGSYLFAIPGGITVLNVPSSVTCIGHHACEGCFALETISIPSSVTNIGQYAFARCSALRSAVIPSTVTKIGNCAFWRCESLKSVILPPSIKEIGGSMFEGCKTLSSIKIPQGVESIGWDAFAYCDSLSHIVLPDGVRSIGGRAFRQSSVNFVVIPASVTNIEDEVFFESRLQAITIPSGVKRIGHYFASSTGLVNVKIPSSVTEIGESAFFRCAKLKDVEFPCAVESIGSYAFGECVSLETVKLPGSITNIGDNAFKDCIRLKSVTMPKRFKGKVNSSIFMGCPHDMVVTYKDI